MYDAFALWYYYESVSRGYENNLEKINRFDHEVEIFQDKRKEIIINGDPYYNRNLMNDKNRF